MAVQTMNINPPKVWNFYFDLYSGGRVYFGRSSFGKGQHVGTPPVMAMFQGVQSYPEDIFITSTHKSMLRIKKEMETAKGFIPDWLRADCYEYLYETLKGE
jgi:hypothetical protein